MILTTNCYQGSYQDPNIVCDVLSTIEEQLLDLRVPRSLLN